MGLNNQCPNCGSTSIYVSDGPWFNDLDECYCVRTCDDCHDSWREFYSVELKDIEKDP